MTFSQLLSLVDDAGCSPEEFGDLIGLSGMTLRRWLKKSKKSLLPKIYIPAVREACYQLIAEGRLKADLPSVQAVLSLSPSHQYEAALYNLGLPKDFSSGADSQDGVLVGLTRIGSQNPKQEEVDRNQKKVFSFRKLGEDWSSRINILWQVIQSKKLGNLDKLVAYGALFYLLTPIDFIPDQIPFFGLLDDFGVLGIAATYYLNKFSVIP